MDHGFFTTKYTTACLKNPNAENVRFNYSSGHDPGRLQKSSFRRRTEEDTAEQIFSGGSKEPRSRRERLEMRGIVAMETASFRPLSIHLS
ncbi:hypothetical protein CEXT_229161 [Caerostris extrusa]|uniref:Uncharacterized protein n=1 Tax=Caerostris extrusa TaxID=172846 RepID=A0AAV4MRB6_CAEEX|nr:hypothetical protein CEXT_229161 [Caerostris extrusa]